MTTTIHNIPIDSVGYVNVSNGNQNCTVFLRSTHSVRAVIADNATQPAVDVAEYIPIAYGSVRSFSITDLLAGDGLWILNDVGPDVITVMRGEAKLTMVAR